MPPFTILQLSTLTFCLPAAAALRDHRYIGAAVYFINVVTSLIVHRRNRLRFERVDTVDEVAVAGWVGYNAYLLYVAVFIHCNNTRILYAIGAVVCAGSVAVCHAAIQLYPYRSARRYALHATMHALGAAGSLAALAAAQQRVWQGCILGA